MRSLVFSAILPILAAARESIGVVKAAQSHPSPTPVPAGKADVEKICGNMIRISINPRFRHFMVMPGDERTFTATLKNPGDVEA